MWLIFFRHNRCSCPDLFSFFRRTTSGCPGNFFSGWNGVISPGTCILISRLKVISSAGMFFSRLSRVCSLKIFLLRWGCNICEFLRQIDESYFSSLPISIVGIKVFAEGLNFRLSLEKFLRKNVVKMSTDELLKIQSEIKALSDDFNAYYADWQGAKVRFVNLTKKFTNVAASMQHESPQAEASAQPTEEHASTADEVQAADENASSRADDPIPAAEEIARASTSGAPEETEEVRATASVAPEENQPDSSAPSAPIPTPILPCAFDVKKTKAAE